MPGPIVRKQVSQYILGIGLATVASGTAGYLWDDLVTKARQRKIRHYYQDHASPANQFHHPVHHH